MEPRFFKRGNAEIPGLLRALVEASMEPRFFKRGNLQLRAQLLTVASSFNGATFFQTWKFDAGQG